MTGDTKSNAELLMASPEAMRRFQDALEQAATAIGINKEIDNILESMRIQLLAAVACGLDSNDLLERYRDRNYEWLLVFATAVGNERGKRLGRARGLEIISESKAFGVLQNTMAVDSKTGSKS